MPPICSHLSAPTLQIYSSDEGRVQTSAAAFTKGLLDLEGDSLTPILVSLVRTMESCVGSDVWALLRMSSRMTSAGVGEAALVSC